MFSVAQIQVEMCYGKNIFDYLQGGMEDLLMGAVPLFPRVFPFHRGNLPSRLASTQLSVSIFRSDAALAILQVLNPLRNDGL
jgi:hypothetical protein